MTKLAAHGTEIGTIYGLTSANRTEIAVAVIGISVFAVACIAVFLVGAIFIVTHF